MKFINKSIFSVEIKRRFPARCVCAFFKNDIRHDIHIDVFDSVFFCVESCPNSRVF